MRDDGRELHTIALLPEGLADLLAGEYVTRVWLEREDDGTLRLTATPAGDPTGEALCRLLCGTDEERAAAGPEFAGGPPQPEPTAEVAEAIEGIKAAWGWD